MIKKVAFNGVFAIFIAGILVGCASGGATTKKFGKGQALPADNTAIAIERLGCGGKCQAYKAVIDTDGNLTYEGIAAMPMMGKYTYIVPIKLIENVQKEATKVMYTRFKDKYPVVTGLPATVTKVRLNGKVKTVLAQSDAPQELKDFQNKLHDEIMAILKEQPPITAPEKQ